MDYGSVLSRAWQIIWRHKVLWIFGILAGCGNAGTSGGSNTGFRFSGDQIPPQIEPFLRQFERVPNWQLVTFALIALAIVLTLIVLAIVLGTVGRIGIIRGTLQAEQGVQTLVFGELFSSSMPYFWRVLVVNLVSGILIALAFIIIGIPLGILTCGAAFLCLVPLAWFVQLVIEQTNIAIVAENAGIGDGLRRGWEIVTRNLGPMIVMALILYLGVGLIAGAIIGLPIALVIGPAAAAFIFGALQDVPQVFGTAAIIAMICVVAYLPILLVLSGVLRAYISSSWTLTFLQLSRRPVVPEYIPPAV